MDFLTGDIRKLYKKFLAASLGSALVLSIYSFVDTIAVGQAEGPAGAAAMAVIGPMYGISVFLALMCGIGGAILMSKARGEGNREKGDAYFTMSAILMVVLTVASWIVFALLGEHILAFFGADAETLRTAMRYARWIIAFWPVIIAPIFLSAFIRNDGAPELAMAAVIIGGLINMFGDWFFVFPLGMGNEGAAIATIIGAGVQTVIMFSYFFRKSCKLHLANPRLLKKAVKNIVAVGFGAGVLDLGTVFLTVIINKQAMHYGGAAALAICGVLTTVFALFQALFSGVGQAVQPLVSANFGAGNGGRICSVFRLSLGTVLALGVVFTLLGLLFPAQIVRLFMTATPEVLSLAPAMLRPYFLLFLFLSVTVLATYYLQSIVQARMAMAISLLHSFIVTGLFLFIMPTLWGLTGVMLAMPAAELVVAVIAVWYIRKRANPNLPKQG